MNTPRDDMPEHDPHISAIYRTTGDIEPPAALDEAVLTSARHAVRQRRQRWMLPLSTAAVLMLGITVLLKLNSEWQPGHDLEGGAPASPALEKKSKDTSVGMLAKKAAPEPQALKAPPQAARAKTEIAESLGFAADSAPMSGSVILEADKQKETESPILSGIVQTEQKVLEPKPWIKKIRKLLEAKKLAESRKELQAFRKHYPDYRLPDDLKSLLP